MKRICIFSQNKKDAREFSSEFKKELLKEKFRITKIKPETIIVLGGHGTLFLAENKFPAIPKIFLRHKEAIKNKEEIIKKTIKKLKLGKFRIVKLIKIIGKINGKKKLEAFNEINIHYKVPTAIRFNVSVNGKKISSELIGDGIVVATPFGSSAYFSNITRKKFDKGLGVAFNNTHKKEKFRIVGSNSKIKINIIRGPGTLCCDGNKKTFNLKTKDIVTIEKSKRISKLIKI